MAPPPHRLDPAGGFRRFAHRGLQRRQRRAGDAVGRCAAGAAHAAGLLGARRGQPRGHARGPARRQRSLARGAPGAREQRRHLHRGALGGARQGRGTRRAGRAVPPERAGRGRAREPPGRRGRQGDPREPQQLACHHPGLHPAAVAHLLPLLFSHRAADARHGRRRGRPFRLRKIPCAPPDEGRGQGALQGCGRRGRGEGGGGGGRRVPARPQALRDPRRARPQRHPSHGPSRHGQDAPGQGHRRRGQRALLQHQRLGLRGDVRGRRRQPRARYVRPGQEERTVHPFYR